MSELLGSPIAGGGPDLIARLLLLYPAAADAPVQPWRDHTLLMVHAPAAGLPSEAHAAARRHVAERLDALFPLSGGVYELRAERFGLVLERHPGLAASTWSLALLLEGPSVDTVSVWLEPLPDDPEHLGMFLRGVRTKIPTSGVHTVHLAETDEEPVVVVGDPDRRPARFRALAPALAMTGALLVMASMVATQNDRGTSRTAVAVGVERAKASTGPAGAVASFEDAGYRMVDDAVGVDGGAVTVLQPSAAGSADSSSPVLSGDAGDTVAAAPPPGVPLELPDVALVAVGTTAGEASALLGTRGRAAVVYLGVPAPDQIPDGLPVVVAVQGTAPPELCGLLGAIPDVTMLGDPVTCPSPDVTPGAPVEVPPPTP